MDHKLEAGELSEFTNAWGWIEEQAKWKAVRQQPANLSISFTRKFGKTTTYVGHFLDSWLRDSLIVIQAAAASSGLEPVVLLPHDIMLADYEERFETLYGHHAAHRVRTSLATRPRLVVVDLAPEAHVDSEFEHLNILEAADREWAQRSSLLILMPATCGLPLKS